MKGALEEKLNADDRRIIGVDEVGRGCLAGNVFAAAVVLDYKKLNDLDPKEKDLISDSKKLSLKKRYLAQELIQQISLETHIAYASVDEIDMINILQASLLAMKRAVSRCQKKANNYVLVDGNKPIPELAYKQAQVIKGDSLVYSIAAASILAKITRDEYMQKQAQLYPNYGFEKHVGYGTKFHMQALEENGVTPIHRRSFAPVRRALEP